MEKSNVLVIGCGGTGNRMLNTLLKIDRRYASLFMNTNMSEMEDLEFFDLNRRCFYIPNADGTGKNRDLAHKYISQEMGSFVALTRKFVAQSHVVLIGGTAGGTGSKAVLMLARLIKKYYPEKTITLIGAFPSLEESGKDFENTLDFWEELCNARRKEIIDNFRFIDNNQSGSLNTINELAMIDLDMSFDIAKNNIDSADISNYHKGRGYNVVLRLDPKITSVKEAIDDAISKSVFYIPDNLECSAIAGSINTSVHSIKEIRRLIPAYDFSKFSEKTEGETVLLLSGCNTPIDAIELMDGCLNDLKTRKSNRQEEETIVISREKKEKTSEKSQETNTPTRITAEELNKLYDDEDFWD